MVPWKSCPQLRTTGLEINNMNCKDLNSVSITSRRVTMSKLLYLSVFKFSHKAWISTSRGIFAMPLSFASLLFFEENKIHIFSKIRLSCCNCWCCLARLPISAYCWRCASPGYGLSHWTVQAPFLASAFHWHAVSSQLKFPTSSQEQGGCGPHKLDDRADFLYLFIFIMQKWQS